jgi:hypothetical protein
MIGWTSGRFWNHTVKAHRPEIQLIDKHVDHPHRVAFSNVIIQILGKQNALSTDFTLDEARHLTPDANHPPTIAGALLALALSAAPAQAGPNRTWVSGTGTDSGACARAAPCKSFAFALTQTAAGGEIDVIDPAGYGPVTINKSISIVNDGVGVAAIGAGSGNGVTINAGASDSVHLRGLTIEGLGSGANGILFNTGGTLAIENCVVRNFGTAGINIAPSTSGSFSV